MEFKISTKVISLMLSMLMVFMAFPAGAFAIGGEQTALNADEAVTALQTEAADAPAGDPTVLFELEDMRGPNEKVFRMSNGNYSSVVYTTDVHYEDNGSWKEIDNTLISSVNGIRNTSSDVSYTFSDESTSLPGVEVEYDGYQLSFEAIDNKISSSAFALKPVKSEKSFDITVLQPESTAEVADTDISDAARMHKANGGITYRSANGTESYHYDLQGRYLKESIILTAPKSTYEYAFRLRADGLTAFLTEAGDVSLCDGTEQIFLIPAPYMTDAAGSYSEAAHYALQNAGAGEWIMTLTADAEWINADDRQFPVIIDPSVAVAKNGSSDYNIYTQYVTSDNMNTYHQGESTFVVGTTNGTNRAYGYMKVNALPTLPANTRLCSAEVRLYMSAYTAYGVSSFDMYVQEALPTWKNQFLSSGATSNTSALLDYASLSSSTTGAWIKLDVTEAAENWYDDSTTNNGIVFYSSTASAGKATFRGFVNSGTASYCPYFVMTYRNIQGVESYYTYYTEGVGRAGSVYVSDYNGSMTLVRTDISDPGYTLQHVYNSNYGDYIFSAENTTSLMHTVDYSNMVVGKGWKLNAQESIISKGVPWVSTTGVRMTAQYLIYTDGDGTEHFFHPTEDDYTYADEDGLGLTIYHDHGANHFAMTDEKGNEKLFVKGYLTKITDTNGNVTAFVYNGATYTTANSSWFPNATGNYLSSIVRHNDGKTAYTVATLGYTDKRLTSITDRYGRTTTYSVSALASDGSGYQINQVTEADGASSYYTYGGGNLRMNRAYDLESGANLTMTYRDGRRDLISMTKSHAATLNGTVTKKSLTYFNMYYKGRSLVRDTGLDLTSGTADDIVCTYAFDDFGRTVSTYCEDGSGEIISASGGTYTANVATNKDNNRLLTSGSMGLYNDDGTSNLVPNGGFENGITGYSAQSGASSVSGSSYVHSGSKALKLTGGSNKQSVYSRNTGITLTASEAQKTTFLLSGWAKANSAPTWDANRTFQISAEIKYSDGTNQYVTAKFNYQAEDQWQYVSIPVVPKHAKAVTDITVHCSYKNNLGNAYFDDLMMVKEPCSTYKYRSDGKLEAVNSTEQAEITYGYNGADLTSVVGGAGGTYTYVYDDAHNVTSVTNLGMTMTIGYDASGHTTSTKLTADGTNKYMQTSAAYSADGSRVTSETDNLGNTTTYGLSAESSGNIRSSVTAPYSNSDGAGGTVTSYTLTNSVGRPTQSYVSGVASLDFAYSKGNLTSVTRGGYIPGNSTKQTQSYTFTYNSFGMPLTTKVGTRTLVTNTYVNNTYLSKSTYGNGATVTYTYDAMGRTLTKTAYGITESYTYDRYNNVNGITMTAGSTLLATVSYTYDSLGRLICSEERNGSNLLKRKLSYVYDTHNRVVSYTYYDGSADRTESYTYNSDGTVATFTVGNGDVITYSYDALKRLEQKDVDGKYTVDYGYYDRTATNTTTLIDEYGYTFGEDNTYRYTYEYDNLGNITKISLSENNGVYQTLAEYEYDSMGQLKMEQLYDEGYSIVYTYDTYGNIRSRAKYDGFAFTDAGLATSIGELLDTDTYTYGDSGWKDLLTSYNGSSITYDAIGNPLTYNNGSTYTMSWTGRQLDSVTKGGVTTTYEYDSSGMRTTKTVGTKNHHYLYYGGQLVRYTISSEGTLYFYYDDNGSPLGFTYTGMQGTSDYYYVLNLQGDIVQLRDSNGNIKANYNYDAWGKLLSVTNASGNVITSSSSMAIINPLRYRGYVYDAETGFYYLQSRYYDPTIGRFISADGLVSTGTGVLGYNMFTYCNNNPVMHSDPSGQSLLEAIDWVIGFIVDAIQKVLVVKYDVPLYAQGDTNLCWAYCQTMVEDYCSNTERSQKNADERARDIATLVNGENDWNSAGWPTNCNQYNPNGVPVFQKNIDSPLMLCLALRLNGPIYAYYNDKDSAHLIVVTGFDYFNDIVYTNNPWGNTGEQTYNEFQNGFAGGTSDGTYSLYGYILTRRCK